MQKFRDCKSQKNNKMALSEQDKMVVLMNSESLWLPEEDLKKIKPTLILTGIREILMNPTLN